MTSREEQIAFSELVLSGIWMLARLVLVKDTGRAWIWRGAAINHMDEIDQKVDAAKKHCRRIYTFPELPPS